MRGYYRVHGALQQPSVDGTPADPALVQRFAMRAIDAARGAGATYADVRLTRTLQQEAGGLLGLHFIDHESVSIGVRALVNGVWGFASTSYWTDDEVIRVAHAAVAQAKTNATAVIQPVELAPVSVATGSWVMPVREDPFLVPWETKLNVIQATTDTAQQQLPQQSHFGGPLSISLLHIVAYRQERALATTDGTYVTQTVYRTGGDLSLTVFDAHQHPVGGAGAESLQMMGWGWELFANAKLIDQVPRMLDEAEFDAQLPAKPVEVGQYDIVCDAATMTSVLDATFGQATEVDRALGDEANAEGTSYLGPDPMQWLGQVVASPVVNVTANRSLDGGVATVKWDDEGVVPHTFPLITAGHLVDYQTTRGSANVLASWYQQKHQPIQSHGCANAEDGQAVTLSMIPNLLLAPSATGPTWKEFVVGLKKGLAIRGGSAWTDFQAKNGMVSGLTYEVKDGKVVSKLRHAGILFSAIELWKSVTALGGPVSVAHRAYREVKGQPSQRIWHTVSAVPAALKNQAVVDVTRKA
jgi:TldD protein